MIATRDDATKQLRKAFDDYMRVAYRDDDTQYNERLFVGVLAFIGINYYKDPYLPVLAYMEDEESKKWWEFWK